MLSQRHSVRRVSPDPISAPTACASREASTPGGRLSSVIPASTTLRATTAYAISQLLYLGLAHTRFPQIAGDAAIPFLKDSKHGQHGGRTCHVERRTDLFLQCCSLRGVTF